MANVRVAVELGGRSARRAPAERSHARPLAPEPAAGGLPAEFAALAATGFPLAPLFDASSEARRIGAAPFDVLLTSGGFCEDHLVEMLALALGVAFFDPVLAEGEGAAGIDADVCAHALRTGKLRIDGSDGRARLLVAARGADIGVLARRRRGRPAGGASIALAGPRAFADFVVRRAGVALAARAALGPGAVAPQFTVAVAMPRIDLRARLAILALAALVAAAIVASKITFAVIGTAFGLFFFAMNAFRLWIAMTPETDVVPLRRGDDRDLPVYTVMVGLAREAAVVPGLLDALERLDYPAAKLDIKLLLEEGDRETLRALERRPPRAGIEVLVLPQGGPKTKPRALNAGLLAARGKLLTVFDAEDRPDPDQLRRALDAFRRGPPELACVQARLAIDNVGDGWLARQFALEYAALFDVGLPALSTLGLPIPLGGTSNHFRTAALRDVGGWDAANVTEDADLGLRLARLGWTTRTIASTTWEEATTTVWPWLKQRTRWLKGYMVTAIVHGRSAGDLARRLGPKRFVATQFVVGGVALTALAFPAVVLAIAAAALNGTLLAPSESMLESALVGVHAANLVVGYAAGLACGWIGVDRRGPARLALDLLTMPFYWLLVGAAAWRALWQILFQSATHWEKTAHGVSSNRRTPPQAGSQR